MTTTWRKPVPCSLLLLLLGGCSAVELPQEHYWRLSVAAPERDELPRSGALRVADLQLGNALSGDFLLYADGPYHLEPRLLHRWVAPLDRLVTDAVVLGLSRSRAFEVVKSAGDPGEQQLVLHGRIVDFAEHRRGDRSVARAGFEFWVERQGEVLFQDEFRAEVPVGDEAGASPEAVVAALSRAQEQVLEQLVRRIRTADVAAHGVEAAPVK